MLFLLTILVVLSAVVSIAVLLKVQQNRRTLSTNNPKKLEPPIYRSLFEPSEAEIRAFEVEEKAKETAKKSEELSQILAGKSKKVCEFQKIWRTLPNKKNTIGFIQIASQSENGEIYSAVAGEILEYWKDAKIVDLTAHELAKMLDSHFWLLSNEQRTSGVKYWLNHEIAGLRRSSTGKK
ncbi:hypothetical protein BH10ACI1_BH10ACI1_14910 [soil metagenome]